MNSQVNAIANRLSLRSPQREALEILAGVCEALPLEKGQDVAACLEAVKERYPSVTDFEREFPSLCFALATGVGKTRLMGAFIGYLFRVEKIRHFFVLAPNLTIYNKLIADFTPNTPKYVFQGIAEFATVPPVVITGDTYEQGIGVRGEYSQQMLVEGVDLGEAHVNIFNISKINSEVRGGREPRVKRLSEYIGQSYFEYLSQLDDLVLLMDESHRYRASAGVKAINDLKPILGLELTATPFTQQGQTRNDFKNIIYSYPLANALTDGFVKEPAVGTRENFDKSNYDDSALERLKLEDGIRFHENTKVELEVYARDNHKPIVKPFVLVVAQDTAHANALVQTIEGGDFFEGRYKGKVITVHSNQRGEEKDETVQQLLTVEDPANPVEIVVHVNMLKEGWDVTNLFTIVPLRAANTYQLVEQTVGRGLRLPYGKRTGNPAVDRLTIVSHDRFQEIINHANDPNSIIRTGVVIGRDIPAEKTRVAVVQPVAQTRILGGGAPGAPEPLFHRPEERQAAQALLAVLPEYERLPSSKELSTPEVQQQLVERVASLMTPAQYEMEGTTARLNLPEVVKLTTAAYITMSMDIPNIFLVPKGGSMAGFRSFDLVPPAVRFQPVDSNLISQALQSRQRYTVGGGSGVVEVERLEDYLVRGLVEFHDINYDADAPLLYKLAGQMVSHLQSYLEDETELRNVLQFHGAQLTALIHTQMQAHTEDGAAEFEVKVTRGFTTIKPVPYKIDDDQPVRNFAHPVPDKENYRKLLFDGFQKCLYPEQRFDSDPERRLAVILESDADVLKWLKPSKDTFHIPYGNADANYNPDFVVETTTAKYICEPKASNETADEIVLAKARAAATWCRHATAHAAANGGKPWHYLLIPDAAIQENKTLQGLAAAHTFV